MKKTAKKSSTRKSVKKMKAAVAKASPKGSGRGTTDGAKPTAQQKRFARRIYKKLLDLYPDAKCALDHRNAYELLIATILSAQCTDKRVNMVTPDLFKAYPDPRALAQAPLTDIEEAVRTTGFYRNKAKAIQKASGIIAQRHGGKVPDTMDELTQLPGVARKTANVVLGNVFGKNDGVVVDTHVGRLSQRIGLSSNTDPKKIERDLMEIFPQETWTMLAHLLIHHGRAVCAARKPKCDQCSLAKDCPKIGVSS